jgi:hypothetical protein
MPMNPRLLRPRASGFNPRSIAGLAAWWDASDASTITTVSGVVSQWNDKSGNGRNFTQATAANRPAVITAGRNGRNVISFGGSPVNMTQPWTRQLNQGNTWIIVFSFSASNPSDERPVLRMDTNPNGIQRGALNATLAKRRNKMGSFAGNASGTLFNVAQPLDFTSDWQIVSSLVSTSSLEHYRNGSLSDATPMDGSIASSSPTTLRIAETANAHTIMQAAEVLIYAKALSAAERSAIERYLGAKWGIPIYSPPDYADADANAYITAVEAADGQALETGVRDAINTFITGCKADGIWSAIKASCILMGARTLSGCLTPLVGTAPTNFNFVSGDYNRKTGLIGNASTKYLNSNRAASADPRNNAHVSVYGSTLDSGTISPLVVRLWLASASATVKNSGLFYLSHTFNNGYYLNLQRDTGNSILDTPFQSSGFVGASRAASGSYTARVKGTNQTFTVASQIPSNDNHAIFAGNVAGTVGDYSAARLAFYSIGESLTLSSLDSRVSTLYAAIGAAIP